MDRSKFLSFKFFEARGVLSDHNRAELWFGGKCLYECRAIYVGQLIEKHPEPEHPFVPWTYEVIDEFVIVVN